MHLVALAWVATVAGQQILQELVEVMM